VNGSEERPRLAVFRSNQHIYAQARARASRRAPAAVRRPRSAFSLAQGLELASRLLPTGD
jgi:ribosomal protein L18